MDSVCLQALNVWLVCWAGEVLTQAVTTWRLATAAIYDRIMKLRREIDEAVLNTPYQTHWQASTECEASGVPSFRACVLKTCAVPMACS